MTRARKSDPKTLFAEYVYAAECRCGPAPLPTPRDISISDLAARHDLSRSTVADLTIDDGSGQSWFEARQRFQGTLQLNVASELADKWVQFETETREKMMQTAVASLDAYREAMANGTVKIQPRDAVLWVQTIRQLFDDIERLRDRETRTINGESVEMEAAQATTIIAEVKALLSGLEGGGDDDNAASGPPEPGPASSPAGSGPEGSRQN
jgi:hypothetical protein